MDFPGDPVVKILHLQCRGHGSDLGCGTKILIMANKKDSMASHQQSRIQAYLEKNRIGPLFEVRRWGAGGPVCLRKKGVQNTPEGSTGREGRHRRGAPVAPVLWHSLCPGQVSWNAAARSPLRLPGRGQVNSGRAGLTQAGIV